MNDVITMSTNYSNFAGILAGFAFSGIYLLIEYEKKESAEVISILLVGFFGLILSSFLFSNITKMTFEEENIIQIKQVGFSVIIASIVFALSIMEMFLSLVFIFILYKMPKQVINLGKIIYYEVSFIVIMFIVTTIPQLYIDEKIIESLTRDLFLTVLFSALVTFVLSKIFMKQLDVIFEKYFIQIITVDTILMLILAGIYRSDMYLREVPYIFAHIVVSIFTINVMTNNFSINHEHRMMILKDMQKDDQQDTP